MTPPPETAALIVAAGRGVRAGTGAPKQYRRVGGEAVLTRTILALLAAPAVTRALVCIHPDDGALYEAAAPMDDRLLPPVHGGASRALTVRAGLEALAAGPCGPPDAVLIHDAARPFVSPRLIAEVIAALDADQGVHDGAMAALPAIDALWRADEHFGELRCAAPLPRAGVWRAQTPQGFRFAAILAAHRANTDESSADDAAIARAAGLSVALVPGGEDNFKITTPADFARAERLVGAEMSETRVGQGYDVHAFAPGDHVTLCGVRLAHDAGLKGHSDADVAMHALTDALFGALAEGDIGRWFPPTDPEWKGAPSEIFLRKAMERLGARGGRLANADVTIICERPKIGSHAGEMRLSLARIMNVAPERLSVKATTSERLGFTGREEGIAAMATATVALPGTDIEGSPS